MSKRGQSKTSQHSQGQGSGLPEISLEPIVKQLRDFIDSEQTSIRYIAEDPIYGLPKAKSLGAKLSKDLLIPEKLLPLVASDDLLRRALGAVLQTGHQNTHYGLGDLARDLRLHHDKFGQFLYTDQLAESLGAILFSPTLFNDHVSREGWSDLEQVRDLISSKFNGSYVYRWRKVATSSLIWGVSKCSDPEAVADYVKGLDLKDLAPGRSQLDHLREVLEDAIESGDRLPLALWKALTLDLRRDLAREINAEAMVNWASVRLRKACERLKQGKAASNYASSSSSVSEEEQKKAKDCVVGSFSNAVRELGDTTEFLTSFIILKQRVISEDPICNILIPQSKAGMKGYRRDPDGYLRDKLSEYVGDELNEDINAVYSRLCGLIAKHNELDCPELLHKCAEHLRDKLGLLIELEPIEEAFWAAIDRAHLRTALSIRLICPPTSKEPSAEWLHRGVLERDCIDDSVKQYQQRIVSSIEEVVNLVNLGLKLKSPISLVSTKVDDLIEAVGVLVPATLYQADDTRLLTALSILARALMKVDLAATESSQVESYWGCQRLARIVGKIVRVSPSFATRMVTIALIETEDKKDIELRAIDLVDRFIDWTKRGMARERASGDQAALTNMQQMAELADTLYTHLGKLRSGVSKPGQSVKGRATKLYIERRGDIDKAIKTRADLIRWHGDFFDRLKESSIEDYHFVVGTIVIIEALKSDAKNLNSDDQISLAKTLINVLNHSLATEFWGKRQERETWAKTLQAFTEGDSLADLAIDRSPQELSRDLQKLRTSGVLDQLLQSLQ